MIDRATSFPAGRSAIPHTNISFGRRLFTGFLGIFPAVIRQIYPEDFTRSVQTPTIFIGKGAVAQYPINIVNIKKDKELQRWGAELYDLPVKEFIEKLTK